MNSSAHTISTFVELALVAIFELKWTRNSSNSSELQCLHTNPRQSTVFLFPQVVRPDIYRRTSVISLASPCDVLHSTRHYLIKFCLTRQKWLYLVVLIVLYGFCPLGVTGENEHMKEFPVHVKTLPSFARTPTWEVRTVARRFYIQTCASSHWRSSPSVGFFSSLSLSAWTYGGPTPKEQFSCFA